MEDAGDKAYVPAEDETNIRRPVSRDEALALIRRSPQIEVLQVKNEKFREQEYKDCIADFCPESWVKVLKTTYNRTRSRGSITSLDRKYQMLLEHALYSEFAFALGIPTGEMQEFIAAHADRAEEPEA